MIRYPVVQPQGLCLLYIMWALAYLSDVIGPSTVAVKGRGFQAWCVCSFERGVKSLKLCSHWARPFHYLK